MSLGSETPRVVYAGNSSTTVFPFSFSYENSSDVEVYLDGVEQVSGFTVNAADVTFSVAPSTGVVIAILRNTPLTQPNTYTDPETVTMEEFEGGLNRVVRMQQDVSDTISQIPQPAPGDTPPGGSFKQLANTTIGQDASGNLTMRTAEEERAHLGVQDIADDVTSALVAAGAAASSAATASASAATAAGWSSDAAGHASSAAASVGAAQAVLQDLAFGDAREHWFYGDPFQADPVISGDVVIQFQDAPPITIKNSARPYTETNAFNGVGNKVSQLLPDIINIMRGSVEDGVSGELYGTADTLVDNYEPFTNWKVKPFVKDGDTEVLFTVSYYGDETFTQALPTGLLLNNYDFEPYDSPALGGGGAEQVTPILTAAIGSPYEDPDVEAVLTATSTTDERGTNHYRRIITGLKELDLWDKVESGFLFGSNHQSSSATIVPFKGASNATGTGTNSGYYVTLNGTSDGYTVPNANVTTADTGRTLVSLYKHGGVNQPSTLISNYEGGVNRGISLAVAGSSTGTTGGAVLDNIYFLVSVDGSAETAHPTVDQASDQDWSFAAGSFLNGTATAMGNSREVSTGSSATAWINRPNWGIGVLPNTAHRFDGDICASIIFSEGLTNGELFNLRLLLEGALSDAIPFPPAIVWEGNSLTAQASGGGTTLPVKVHGEAGWSGIRNEVPALGGARQLERIEAQYYNVCRRWVGANRARRIFWLWSGVNDVTAGSSSADIIASLERELIAAKADGFYTIIAPLTPVADAGAGLTYGYSTAQQTVLSEVNAWIAGRGAAIADQFLNINNIANTYPEFGDPTDSTYYTAGDGLHHNDAGRTLIKDYFVANVDIPTT